MTFEPTSISGRFEDVIVQKSPARPQYSEHSFVTWSAPLRGKDADAPAATPDTASLAPGLVGNRGSAHAPAASAPAHTHPRTTRVCVRKIANLIAHLPALPPICVAAADA